MNHDLKNHFVLSKGQCMQGSEPCPMMYCRYHIHSDAKPSQIALAPVPTATCSLRLASYGGMTLDAIGTILGLTRERVRQIENMATRKMKKKLAVLGLQWTDMTSTGGSPSGHGRGEVKGHY
jgi:hypothetical protein